MRAARRAAAVVGPIVLYALIAAWMFKGTSRLGMEFDEVFRVNNLVAHVYPSAQPYDQAISWISVFGHRIPLMYKAYISSAYLVSFLPLPLFPDPLTGIRALYCAYVVLVAALGFLLFRRRSYPVAFVVPLLALVSPLLYPEITYGFVDVLCIAPLLVAVWFFRRFVRGQSAWALFWTALFAAASINISFYVCWLVAAFLVSGALLYPGTFRAIVTSGRNWLALVAGALIGLFNYVYYNLVQGFPSITPVINRIFFPARYNEHPIDSKKSAGLLKDVLIHARYAAGLLGDSGWFVAVVAVAGLAVTIAGVALAVRRRELSAIRLPVMAELATVLALGMILISPNTTRRGHYAMLVGMFECAFVGAFLVAVRFGPDILRRWKRIVAVALAASLAVSYATTSRESLDSAIDSGGEGFFSDAIFDLHDYLLEHAIDDDDVLQVQWGSYAQLYFLSEGQYLSPSVVFQVLGSPNLDGRVRIVLDEAAELSAAVVVPVYTAVGSSDGGNAVDVMRTIANDGEESVCTLAVFSDRRGKEQIRLFRMTADGGATSRDADARCSGGR